MRLQRLKSKYHENAMGMSIKQKLILWGKGQRKPQNKDDVGYKLEG